MTDVGAGTRRLTREEAAALLAEAERRKARAPHLADFIRLGLHAGMRPGEMLGLEWKLVDLKGDAVTFEAHHQKNGKPGRVPLNREAREAREAMLSRARFRATHCPSSPWVFCDKLGERIASVKTSFAGCVRAAGLVDGHPHDLRRTCGSWLVQAGVGIERVSEILRHADVSVTARVYAHLRPRDLAEALAVLDRQGATFSHRFSRRRTAEQKGGEDPTATG